MEGELAVLQLALARVVLGGSMVVGGQIMHKQDSEEVEEVAAAVVQSLEREWGALVAEAAVVALSLIKSMEAREALEEEEGAPELEEEGTVVLAEVEGAL
jgi:hypothetical protein